MAGETLRFDPDEFTIGDLEDFEDACGTDLMSLLAGKSLADGLPLNAKQLKALVWVLKKKDDPAFTLEQARDVKIAALEVAAPAGPPVSNGSRGSRRSATSGG